MNYRPLGDTGLEVSEIGFGAWGIGGAKNGALGYGPTDDRESAAALTQAYDLGINFYDTSDLYGYGHSERLIGTSLKDVRHKIVIATKVGFQDASGAQDFSPEHIRRALEESLKRLQSDYVDLYQLHSPPMDVFSHDDGILSALHALQHEGKIRAFGISVSSPEDGFVAVTELGFKSIQVNFNLVDQRALKNGLFDLCKKHHVGIIVRTPLCFGFLTGAYSPETKFDANDHRSRWSAEQITRWASAYEVFSSALNVDEEQTHAQIALRFCLSYQGVSTVIPGMLTQKEVEENVVASQLGPLVEMELLGIEKIHENNTFLIRR